MIIGQFKHRTRESWLLAGSLLIATLAFTAPARAADNPYLYGIHWWGYSGGAVDPTPAALLDCPTHGGWTLETIITHSDPWWGAAYYAPLYTDLYNNKKMSIITRIDYNWGQTVPAPTNPHYASWPNTVVNVVNTLRHGSHLWVLGNEPNIIGEGVGWPDSKVTPAGYAQIYRNVRNAIRNSAQPSPTGPHLLLVGAPSPGGIIPGVRWMDGNQWLSEVIDHIPNEEIDGFAIHAYGWNVADFRNGYRPQLALIDSKGLQNRPVYMTEWNRRVQSPDDEANSAQFLRDAFADVNAWNQTPGNHNIISMCWFVYDGDNGWSDYSIEYWKNNGFPYGDPRDLYTAFEQTVDLRYPAGKSGINGAILTRSPAGFTRTVVQGRNLPNDVFTVTNAGTDTLNYAVTENSAWLSVDPTTGASAGETDSISIVYNTAILPAGEHSAIITIADPDANDSPQTVVVNLTVLEKPVPGDMDGDRDVDQADFNLFRQCMTGPNQGPTPAGCELADIDNDDDVDQDDFGRFQRCMTGSGFAGDPDC